MYMFSKIPYSQNWSIVCYFVCLHYQQTYDRRHNYIGLHYSGFKLIKQMHTFQITKHIYCLFHLNIHCPLWVLVHSSDRGTDHGYCTGHLWLYLYLPHHAPSPSHNLAHFLRRTGRDRGDCIVIDLDNIFQKQYTHL